MLCLNKMGQDGEVWNGEGFFEGWSEIEGSNYRPQKMRINR